MTITERLVAHRSTRVVGPVCRIGLRLLGVSIPRSVRIGDGLTLLHGGHGVVIHPRTTIGNNVILHHAVTLGRGDVYVRESNSAMQGIVIGDDVVLGAGAVVVCSRGTLQVGRGTVVAANAVLTQSTGEWEIWGGVPARRLGPRPMTGGTA